MIRYVLGAAFALLLCTVTILAAEYKGKVVAVDTEKNTITISIPGEKEGDKPTEKKLSFDKDKIKVLNAKDKDVKKGLENKMFSKETLDDKKGPNVVVTTEGEKEKEMITVIKLAPAAAKDK